MSKEYIEREKAIEWFMAFVHMGESDIPAETVISDLKYAISAADVTPVRRGRWIEEDGIQICSECGEEHEWEDYRAPYCDTCGAKMNKEDGE
nr:MAG TPA: DNA-directed RNA polymerase II subunit [Caudoviricetes sp.]